MNLNFYGEQLLRIIQGHGVPLALAQAIAFDLQERKWSPYSRVADSPTAQQLNFGDLGQ
jgi:hypothetical protein